MDVPKKIIDANDVIIDQIEDPEKKEYHRKRYTECLRQLVRELYASDKVNDILAKYKVTFLIEIIDPHVGFELPE